jgi:uncharacterized protein YggE
VDFRNSELRKYRDQARALAVKAAIEKAATLAAVAGLKVGKTTNMTSYSYAAWYGRTGRGNFQNVSRNIAQVGPGSSPEGTIALGKINVTASVTMSFRLE